MKTFGALLAVWMLTGCPETTEQNTDIGIGSPDVSAQDGDTSPDVSADPDAPETQAEVSPDASPGPSCSFCR